MNNKGYEIIFERDDVLIDELKNKMEKYIGEIILFNSAYNLTNTSERDELLVRHIFDSLAPYGEIKKLLNERAAFLGTPGDFTAITVGDIGSGGGLPGIPLAAAFPQIKFCLVERMEKRCSFLENCAAVLGLKNVEVINSEAERLEPQMFDLITFRAFRPLDKKMTKTLLKIVKPQGKLCAYKAKMESIKEEMDGIKEIVPSYDCIKLNVPGLEDSERNLVVITKN